MTIIKEIPDMNKCFTKKGSAFIITLKDGRETYYDFNTDTIYGVTGKPVKTFCNEAKSYLAFYYEKDFLVQFLYTRFVSNCFPSDNSKLVEEVYRIFNNVAAIDQLYEIYYFFDYNNEYKINEETISIIYNLVSKIKYCSRYLILEKVMKIPEELSPIFQHLSKECQQIMSKDRNKIMLAFYKDVENWIKRVYDFPYIFTAYVCYCKEHKLSRNYENMIKFYDEVNNNEI